MKISFLLSVVGYVQWTTWVAAVQNYVLATDDKYVMPTAVAVQSVKTSDPYSTFQIIIFTDGVSRENVDKLQTMSNERCTIVLVDLQEPQWKSMPTIDGQQIDLMDFANKIKSDRWSRLVNLRLLFPDIWYSGLLPESVQNLDSFLWLDSDLIVVKSLAPLFDECECINQEIIGANLYFPLHGGVGWVNTQYIFDSSSTDQDDEHGFARISGGVVFWKIEMLVNRFILQGFNEFLALYWERKRRERENPQEETIMGDFLRQQKRVYFFSPQYNANPDPAFQCSLLTAWPEIPTEADYRQRIHMGLIRNDERGNPLTALEAQKDMICFNEHMQALCKGDVCIFHWDCVKKPWKKSRSTVYSDIPTCLWTICRQQTPFKTSFPTPQKIEIDLTE
ncbi:MAG: hypothetical protein LBE99_03820 [Puniceicoccales bacterium]|jgi:hypothetical protein|nr:hypothetical protein [Puniceicoccales bacterium]